MDRQLTAFIGAERLLSGSEDEVARAVAALSADGRQANVHVFDDSNGRPVDLDLLAIVARHGDVLPRPRGRPKLGVVAREVTLLPRHWEWLADQPGGASAALRRLVDEARKTNVGRDAARRAKEAAYRFLLDMAGDRPGYEDATRALFASDRPRFDALVAGWPKDVRDYARRLAAPAFDEEPE